MASCPDRDYWAVRRAIVPNVEGGYGVKLNGQVQASHGVPRTHVLRRIDPHIPSTAADMPITDTTRYSGTVRVDYTIYSY